MKEETGLVITNPQIIDTFSTFFTWEDSLKKLYHYQSLQLYYTCDLVEGELSIDGHDEYEQARNLELIWIPLEELDTLKVGGTVDWRPIVKKQIAITLENR